VGRGGGRAGGSGARADDWASWWVYADWLCDRGELVALEHRLAFEGLPVEERRALRAQADALTEGQHQVCLETLALPEGSSIQLRHGFVVGVRLPWRDETLAILDALVAHPPARLLTQLDLSDNGIGPDDVRTLAVWGTLCQFTELHLGGNHLGDEGARALASSDTLRHLTQLDLSYNDIDPDGARALAASDTLCHLSELHLGGDELGPEAAHALAASGTLCQLTTLHLAGNDIGRAGRAARAAAACLRGLRPLLLR
jgi:hypothetical protein